LCFLDQPKTMLAPKNPWPPKFVATRFTIPILGCSLYSRTQTVQRAELDSHSEEQKNLESHMLCTYRKTWTWIYAQNISCRVHDSHTEWSNTKKPWMLTIWVSAGP
jgi:hypothetical protein